MALYTGRWFVPVGFSLTGGIVAFRLAREAALAHLNSIVCQRSSTSVRPHPALSMKRSSMPGNRQNSGLDDELDAFAVARVQASLKKRKLERMCGALYALDALGSGRSLSRSDLLVTVETELSAAHSALVHLLEQCDGGEAFKRKRAEWLELGGTAEFVRSHDELKQYLPALQREVADAREAWEAVQPARKELAAQKKLLARLQGRFQAQLELELASPAELKDELSQDVILQQRKRWATEESSDKKESIGVNELLERRRQHLDQFHREQGWRRGVERFGKIMGLTADAMLSVRLTIMEADASQLRLRSNAQIHALSQLKSQHDHMQGEFHKCSGHLETLRSFKEQHRGFDELRAEEYETSLEVEVLRGTLDSLSPRLAEAASLRFAWHAKAGAHKAGEALRAPNLIEMQKQLADAQQLAEAAEPLRCEDFALRAKLSKLRGRLKGLASLQQLSSKRIDMTEMRMEVERLLTGVQLASLQVSMQVTNLKLLTMNYEKAEANLHAAGGAIICIKKLQHALRVGHRSLRPEGASTLPVWSRRVTSKDRLQLDCNDFDACDTLPTSTTGPITAEMHGFIRSCFVPMLKAAALQLMLQRPAKPISFIAEWFWQHSTSHQSRYSGSVLTWSDVEHRCRAILKLTRELGQVNRDISSGMDRQQQAVGASAMLQESLSGLNASEVCFESLHNLREDDCCKAWTLPDPWTQADTANAQVLDVVISVLKYYPQVLLQVHVIPPNLDHVPQCLVSALLSTSNQGMASESNVSLSANTDAALMNLARRRAEAIVALLIARGLHPKQLVATAPGIDLGMKNSGMFTIHELPPAVDPRCSPPESLISTSEHAHRPQSDSIQQVALLTLRQHREAALKSAQIELAELRDYACRLPSLSLSRGAVTLVVSVSTGAPGPSRNDGRARQPTETVIACGNHRVKGDLAAFEMNDAAIDEVDVEIWIPTAFDQYGVREVASGGTGLLGSCTVDVSALLHGELPEISATLPVIDKSGFINSSRSITIESHQQLYDIASTQTFHSTHNRMLSTT